MLNDYNLVYDEDLSFCDKVMKDIVYQYVYDSDVYQRKQVIIRTCHAPTFSDTIFSKPERN